MNLNNIKDILIRDEGVVYQIYNDHLGYATFGIGHLVTKDDPEWGLPVGTPVSKSRVMQVFEEDLKEVEVSVRKMFPQFISYPHNVQLVLLSMMFQLGYTRLNKFKRFKAAIKTQKWPTAANEMLDSKWARQTPNRVARLMELMNNAN